MSKQNPEYVIESRGWCKVVCGDCLEYKSNVVIHSTRTAAGYHPKRTIKEVETRTGQKAGYCDHVNVSA